jgi:hypothetical protein
MSFKGIIGLGSTVLASFSSDPTNDGSACLLLGLASFTGSADANGAVIATGGSGAAHLTANTPGILRVFVDVAGDEDTGWLEVKLNGATADAQAVSGDTTWTYSVQ